MMLLTAWLVLMAAAGLTVGSFVTTAALRAVRNEQALTGSSRCDGCGLRLDFVASLPVVSFIRLRGACAGCGGRIDRLHPAGELAGLLILAVPFVLLSPVKAALVATLGFALLALAVSDARSRRLPDPIVLAVALLCGTLSLLRSPAALAEGATAAVVAFTLMEAVRRSFLLLRRKPGMGFGDVKLVAALALWLGATSAWMVLAAALLGLMTLLVWRPRDGLIPFGPMLALAGWGLGLAMEVRSWPGL